MRKFIALQNDVYYSVVEENGKMKFFANLKGSPYYTRTDVTPEDAPDEALINEIHKRSALGEEMSPQLQAFVNKLEENFRVL